MTLRPIITTHQILTKFCIVFNWRMANTMVTIIFQNSYDTPLIRLLTENWRQKISWAHAKEIKKSEKSFFKFLKKLFSFLRYGSSKFFMVNFLFKICWNMECSTERWWRHGGAKKMLTIFEMLCLKLHLLLAIQTLQRCK